MCGVVVVEEDKGERLREIFEVCVCVHVCVHNYISKLNYQYFLIVFTTSLHASPTATITSVVDVTTISGDNVDLTMDNR